MKLKPHEVFNLYITIKLHFDNKSNYDFFKYGGKLSRIPSFEHRKDKSFFYKLSNQYSKDELTDLFAANFLSNSKTWVGDLDPNLLYEKQKYDAAPTYYFKNDVETIFSINKPLDIFKKTKYSILLGAYYAKEISPNTIVILNKLVPFLNKWIDDSIVSDSAYALSQYEPFVKFDRKSITEIFMEKVNKNR